MVIQIQKYIKQKKSNSSSLKFQAQDNKYLINKRLKEKKDKKKNKDKNQKKEKKHKKQNREKKEKNNKKERKKSQMINPIKKKRLFKIHLNLMKNPIKQKMMRPNNMMKLLLWQENKIWKQLKLMDKKSQ